MTKDEIKEKYYNCELARPMYAASDGNFYLQPTGIRIIDILESLRPYVELGEWALLNKETIIDHLVAFQEFKLKDQFKDIIKKIKEQKKV